MGQKFGTWKSRFDHFFDEGLERIKARLSQLIPPPVRKSRTLRAADLDGEKMFNSDPRDGCVEEEKSEQILVGNTIALLPLRAAASIAQPELTFISVKDIPPFETCLAVLQDHRERRIHQAFMTTAVDPLKRQPLRPRQGKRPRPTLFNELKDGVTKEGARLG